MYSPHRMTLNDYKRAWDRLGVSLPIPKAMVNTPDLFLEEWRRVLDHHRPNEVDAAVSAYLDSGARYFPTPGQLAHLSYDLRPRKPMPPIGEDRTDWFAYPVRATDLKGPRYRMMSLDEARGRGAGPVESATCPVDGCECFAVEVWLVPRDMGLPPQVRNATLELALAHPRGWRWAHVAMAQNLQPCSRTAPPPARVVVNR